MQTMGTVLPVEPVSAERVRRMADENDALRQLVLRIEEMARRTGEPAQVRPGHRQPANVHGEMNERQG